jgi:hypothetical protein
MPARCGPVVTWVGKRCGAYVPDHPSHSALLLVVWGAAAVAPFLARMLRRTITVVATLLALVPAGTVVTSPPAGNTISSTAVAALSLSAFCAWALAAKQQEHSVHGPRCISILGLGSEAAGAEAKSTGSVPAHGPDGVHFRCTVCTSQTHLEVLLGGSYPGI